MLITIPLIYFQAIAISNASSFGFPLPSRFGLVIHLASSGFSLFTTLLGRLLTGLLAFLLLFCQFFLFFFCSASDPCTLAS